MDDLAKMQRKLKEGAMHTHSLTNTTHTHARTHTRTHGLPTR